ncbi:sodium:solute symporter [Capsulimonas corticalis]|uniref:Sodium:solute symporter n=1 Tax=Capsulimonas corticalis TaxID=2219043 RepID=A0A402CTS7_9BACT|nr:sodium:solute symporter family protein [Capsulimonas corticalis]BDI30631.1 sodium:solute symporter [Capsulimonas corticalis]
MTNPVRFAPLDYALIAIYFAFLVVIGVFTARRKVTGESSEDFMLAGRSLTLPAFVASLVATWYGGILGVGQFAYESGVATWTVFGLPYYLFAVIYAFFLAGKVRGVARLTIPDTLQSAHSRPVALLGSLFLFCLVTPAPYTLMLGTMLHDMFGWPLLLALILGTILSVAFVVTGGFNTDVRTNIFQFLLMFTSFAMILGFAVVKHGGVGAMFAQLPPTLRQPSGGLAWPLIVVWYFIAMWTLVDPGFHQRCSAASSPRTARNGILISVLCWALFDFMTITTGLYARVLLPHLSNTVEAYPALSQLILPAGAKGYFWVGMLATVMSTVISYTLIAAITVGRDIVWRFAPQRTGESDVFWTRIGVVVSSALAILAAYKLPTVVGLWYTIGTAFIPGLLLPLLTAYSPRVRVAPPYTFVAMLLGVALPIVWMVLGYKAGGMDEDHYPWRIEPIYLGLGASTLVWAAGRIAGGRVKSAAPAAV